MEAAAELVVDAAVGHLVEREPHHRRGPRVAGRHPPQQVFERHRLRELGRAAPRAVAGVELGFERRVDGLEERRRSTASGRRRHRRDAVTARRAPRPAAARRRSTSARCVRHASDTPVEDLPERRHPVARLVREVRAAVERLAVGRQEHRHRPAAAAGHRLDGRHVDRVEVGALLAVDLDRHEAGRSGAGRSPRPRTTRAP